MKNESQCVVFVTIYLKINSSISVDSCLERTGATGDVSEQISHVVKQSSPNLEALDRDLMVVGLPWRPSEPAVSIRFPARVPGIFVESLEKN